MRILILGVTGMLGNAMFRFMANKAGIGVYGTMRDSNAYAHFPQDLAKQIIAPIDVENYDSLIKTFAAIQPSIVINCIGLVKQSEDSNNPLHAIPINALLPHRLARLCQIINARLIHISTDCVFSGSKGNYTENDFADANDLYGRSKFLGEVDYPNTITLRTSIIGHELGRQRSLIGWFLEQQSSVKGFTRVIFSGLTTMELAKIVYNIVIPNPNLTGLYHVAAKPINKFDLLHLVAKIYQKTIEIIPSNKLIIDRSLNAERFNQATGYATPEWPKLIKAMYEFK